ncbi:hypothetical protein DDT91_20570 [Algoriphagus sp. AK58]|nr:hypothetical protein [Algoriphagus sp. AK58]
MGGVVKPSLGLVELLVKKQIIRFLNRQLWLKPEIRTQIFKEWNKARILFKFWLLNICKVKKGPYELYSIYLVP